jgi:dTDP-4-dehydrorhamnose reductase
MAANELRSFIIHHNPNVIVNAAAYTAVDRAETESARAFLINAEAPAIIAETCRKLDALLIHYSTDYIFDGKKTSSYTEEDRPNPINTYGQSKLTGERNIQISGSDYLIFRTSWVYAARGRNFLKTMLRLTKERQQLNIVADQIGAPTWARLIADTTAHALKQSMLERQQKRFIPDIYHLAASGETSWYGFATTIIELLQQLEDSETRNCLIKPITTADYPLPAKRPANSRLALDHLEHHFGVQMPNWEKSLILCLEELLAI